MHQQIYTLLIQTYSHLNLLIGHSGSVSVTVRGHGLVLSIVHLPPLTVDSPFTFTVLLIFFADTFQYIVW